MDVIATRGWGIAVSGAMIVAALVLAVTAQPITAPGRQAATPSPAQSVPGAASAATSPAMLVVHFRGRGPLARAERARSERRVSTELSRQRAFHGLCFARFERRGVALHACDGAGLSGWPQRLRPMRAVAKVEAGD